jgi:hypothetical protein
MLLLKYVLPLIQLFVMVSPLPLSLSLKANAESSPSSQDVQKQVTDALKAVTFKNLPAFTNDVDFKGDARVPLKPFSWKAGQKVADTLPLQIALMIADPQKAFTPEGIANDLGIDSSTFLDGALKNMPYLKSLKIKDLLKLDPSLKDLPLDAAKGWPSALITDFQATTLGNLATNGFGDNSIPDSVLNNTKIGEFGNIAKVDYKEVSKIVGELPVKDFYGLSDLSFDKIISVTTLPDTVVPLQTDIALTNEPSKNQLNVVTGSNKEPKSQCKDDKCSWLQGRGIALANASNVQNPYNGVMLQSAKGATKLKGGEGVVGELMTAAGVRESTGLSIPYMGGQCGAKLIINDINAKTGTASQSIAFRACWSDFILGYQATPFFIEVPFLWTLKEKGSTFDKLILPSLVSPSVKVSASIPPSMTNALTANTPASPSAAVTTPSNTSTPAQPVAAAQATLFGHGNGFNAFSPATGVTNG